MANLTQNSLEAVQAISGTSPFVWIYEIEVPTDPETRYRFAGNYTTSVTFRGNIYYPFPVTHSITREESDGSLQGTSLIVSNITRQTISVLKTHNGLIGQPVRIMLVNTFELASGIPMMETDYTIGSIEIDDISVRASLVLFNAYASMFPSNKLTRGHCRLQYRGAGCGYIVPEADGGLPTCDQSHDGPNGCVVHGESEVAAGYTQQHPSRFGGFPGIPRQIIGGAV